VNLTLGVTRCNPNDIYITQTDFYRWLDKGNYSAFAYTDILEYLQQCFFYTSGEDTVDYNTVQNLKTIHTHFTDSVMKPIWSYNGIHNSSS